MTSLTAAIREKYDSANLEVSETHSFIKVYVPKSGPHVTDDSNTLKLPPRLTLDNLQISEAGDGQDITELCANVTELDLTKNCITQWREVFTILQHMPSLHFLNLTLNCIDNLSVNNIKPESYPNLQNLVLNDTGVSWQSVAKLLPCFQSLSELHLSLNKYCDVDLPPDFRHGTLTKLFINNCNISEWSEISKLGLAFPCLQTLIIIQSHIRCLSDAEVYEEFPELNTLNISNSELESWIEIDKFCRFPSLTNLRIFEVPFMEVMEAKLRRQHLVARLPNITQLNGTNISELEREDAERAFIRHFMDKADKPDRFFELEKQYGKLDPLAKVDLRPKQFINMQVTFEDKEEHMDVYLQQTVGDFKKLLQSFTGLPPSKFRLYYIETLDGKEIDTVELKMPNQSLLSLCINVGDKFVTDRK